MPTPAPAAASSGYPGEPKVPKTLKAPEEAAKQALKKAMEQKDAAVLKEALSAALDCQVSGKVVMEAVDLLSVLQAPVSPTSGRSPSQEALMSNNHSVPVGLQISRTCDRLFHAFCHPGELDADACLADWCRRAREATAPEVLQQSVFGLLYPDDIKKFLLSPDNKLWHDIMEKTEKFIQAIAAKEPAGSPPWSLQEMTPEAGNERLKHLKPVIMDHTVREPATNTPFGHTGYMKYLTLQIVREMGMRDIAISGMYYKASYTPETQILEELWARGESMEGLILMFGPGREDRKAGIQAIKDFNVPNAFLDLTLKASARFAQEDFVTSVLDAVRELDKIFLEQGLPENPWRKDDDFNRTPGKGEISLNLVDLMEFLKLKNSSRQPGTAIDDACVQAAMDAEAAKQAAKAFQTWKNDPVFCRRVVAILSEEGRGCANYLDYGVIAHWLRQHFRVEDQFRILVHAHAGDNNTQDAASVEAVLHGADGVWAAVIPQAAQGGHNSSLVFLDNMLQLGNQHVLDDFWLHQAAQSARHCYYLNFNTYDIPEDCPIWGRRVNQLLHTAFSKVSGEEWRKRRGNYYDVWRPDLRASFDNEEYKKLCGKLHKEVRQVRNDNCVTANYRISPLVSDVETWRLRMDELQADLLERRERLGDFPHDVRCLGFALMNANIRANLDERDTLKQLVDIVRRKKLQRATFPEVAAYEKAKQHQGDERMA
ncbi:unnamed protein product [Effrenium voratum]|uniref:Uncharacterized protein n=1 Tax=Effrenium voratum TaxID=2562239 RepID=A0AA36JEA7_9DINO|nr:unnamed protein product [Effrenium voratum]